MDREKYQNWDLRFTKKDLESQYIESKKNYQQFFLNIILLFALLSGIIFWSSNPLNNKDNFGWKMVLISISVLAFTLTVFIVGVKAPRSREYLIILITTSLYFGLMEASYWNRSKWNEMMFFFTGLNSEFIAFPLILGKISWKSSLLFSAVMNALNSFRYTNQVSDKELNIFPLFLSFQNFFLLAFSAFFFEKFDRDSFHKIKKYEYSLSLYKDLVTNIFPAAVIILKQDKIVFHNQEALRIMESDNEWDLWTSLQDLLINENLETNFETKRVTTATEETRPIAKKLITLESINCINTKQSFIRSPTLRRPRALTHRAKYGDLEIGGKLKNLEVKTTKIVWEGQKAIMIIISESRVVRKMKMINEQSEYKDQLLATVSHDLRTPLNGIIGMNRMASELITDKEGLKYLKVALRSSDLLLMMINDILDYSQIANGKLRLNYENCDLWEIIKDVSKLFKFQSKMKGLSFYKENLCGKENSSTIIKSDQNRLKQVLFNLLGNALKFTSKGMIKISLEWLEEFNNPGIIQSEKQGVFQIKVEDTGIGIKEEDQKKLFKLYGKIQNESTNVLNKTGVGLGLAISQSLVQILNDSREDGEIKVESRYGKGTCFSFLIGSNVNNEEQLFPSNISEITNKESQNKVIAIERKIDKNWRSKLKPNISHGNLKQRRQILLVDDDLINIMVVSKYLKSMEDILFDISFDGENALETLKKKAQENLYYDFILLDCNMPITNGFEVSLIINQLIHDGYLPPLVIIACTANASPKDFELCIQSGMNDRLIKPFSREELRKKLEKYF